MNLPNRLTILRIVLTFVFVFFVLRDGVASKIGAAIIFLLASLTDFYDGYYAKKYNLVSDFGKLMDPIADKFLILTAFYIFMALHLIQGWMFVLIFVREIVVTCIRLYAVRRSEILAAEQAGKIKTVLQMAAISAMLIFIIIAQINLPGGHVSSVLLSKFYNCIYVFMFAVVGMTMFSGLSFLWNNRKFLYE